MAVILIGQNESRHGGEPLALFLRSQHIGFGPILHKQTTVRRYLHIRRHTSCDTTPLSSYFANETQQFVTDQHIRDAVKRAATVLMYPTTRGTPISLINTHSLRIGGACALALAGYSDTQIQKMGRWKGATFKEYVRENLSNYAEGMSKAMKKVHGFVNIDAGAYKDVTALCMEMEYGMQLSQ
eukprot:scaffold24801_cov70-Skeletonema_dohrnii-CCMP3373.AAC.1